MERKTEKKEKPVSKKCICGKGGDHREEPGGQDGFLSRPDKM